MLFLTPTEGTEYWSMNTSEINNSESTVIIAGLFHCRWNTCYWNENYAKM